MTWLDLFNYISFFALGYGLNGVILTFKRKTRMIGKYKTFMQDTPEENFKFIKRLLIENKELRDELARKNHEK